MPPPTAVNTPIMTQESTGSPKDSAFTQPVAAHSAETTASPCTRNSSHTRPLKYTNLAMSAPVNARMRYSGCAMAATVP